MSGAVDYSRRKFLTGRTVKSVATPDGQEYGLELQGHCLTFQNIVCESCRDACEFNAVRFKPQLGKVARPSISSDLCTGCGDCVSACPVNALVRRG